VKVILESIFWNNADRNVLRHEGDSIWATNHPALIVRTTIKIQTRILPAT
jgi:hypothetical protein